MKLYFGSEEPDTTFDLDLQGNHQPWSFDGDLNGGDINGDGFGDIITGLWAGYMTDGEVHIHFGSRWMGNNADIIINALEDYGEVYERLGSHLGAIDDYNGDGLNDFLGSTLYNDNEALPLVIFSGNDEWEHSAPLKNHLLPEHISLKAFPNPLNSTINFTFSLIQTAEVTIDIHNTAGRRVDILVRHYIIDIK